MSTVDAVTSSQLAGALAHNAVIFIARMIA